MMTGGFQPVRQALGQHPADPCRRGNFAVVRQGSSRHLECRATPSSTSGALYFYRYPSPSLRPGPQRVRSFLLRMWVDSGCIGRTIAYGELCPSCTFLRQPRLVMLRATRNLIGGRALCSTSNLSLEWQSLLPCPPAPNRGKAKASRPTARSWVRGAARCLARQQTTIWPKAPLSAASPVLPLVTRVSATDLIRRSPSGAATT